MASNLRHVSTDYQNSRDGFGSEGVPPSLLVGRFTTNEEAHEFFGNSHKKRPGHSGKSESAGAFISDRGNDQTVTLSAVSLNSAI
jgi:hypothetical protein